MSGFGFLEYPIIDSHVPMTNGHWNEENLIEVNKDEEEKMERNMEESLNFWGILGNETKKISKFSS